MQAISAADCVYCNSIKIVSYIGSIMRPVPASFSLLLCLIRARADKLSVINNSEAFLLRRQSRRGTRLSFSCPNQLTRDHVYQFRTRIPNQTFVGSIASTQESLTLVARKTTLLSMAALSLILTASHSLAGLGWTLGQFKQQYGEPRFKSGTD